MSREPQLSEDEVWELVKEYADACRRGDIPIYTLSKRIHNRIVAVREHRIERESVAGGPQTGHITERQIHRLWDALHTTDKVAKGSWNFFALPLLQGALPNLVEDLRDGSIALREDLPSRFWYDESESESYKTPERSAPEIQRPGGGEGPRHWRLKHYIAEYPDRALEALAGGPWADVKLELTLRLPTCDRVDVFMREAKSRRPLFVEVKPAVTDHDFSYYAQAAKYRTIWQILHDLDAADVRCAIAAPSIPRQLAKHMLERFQIESVAVTVPADYIPPPRE